MQWWVAEQDFSRVGRRDVLYIISGILHSYVKYEYYIVYAIK